MCSRIMLNVQVNMICAVIQDPSEVVHAGGQVLSSSSVGNLCVTDVPLRKVDMESLMASCTTLPESCSE